MSIGALEMARKPKKPPGGGKASRKSPDVEPRLPIVSIRGRVAWKLWLDELAAFDRSTLNDLIDRALVRYARDIGFTKEPPER
jgi:hypothetical protein